MKGKILNILRSDSNVVSGEMLSKKLGISRVSVWKHLQKLRRLGYDIAATPKGYRMAGDPDLLFPWEFPGREKRIHYFEEVTSTMDIARGLARKGCADFTTVIAGRQKKGRGRLKRNWLSAGGGLYFTVVLRPEIPPGLTHRITFSASLIMARTLREMLGINAMVKWPNDILVEGEKISGMLSEMEAEADRVSFVNVGIGVNVNNDPTPEVPAASSLKRLLGRQVSRKWILARFLDEFENKVKDASFGNVISEWKRYTVTLNQKVRIVTTRDVTEGMARDVDEDGALVLELEDGSIRRVLYGDCFHQE